MLKWVCNGCGKDIPRSLVWINTVNITIGNWPFVESAHLCGECQIKLIETITQMGLAPLLRTTTEESK